MNLEELLSADKPPPSPAKGIPRQKIPSWIRWPVRIFFVPFIYLDLIMQKFARFLIRPPYKQIGKCKKRGNCCYNIMIRKPKGLLGWVFKFWNTEINGFYLRSSEIYEYENHKVMVMGCRYLQKDGSCKHYRLRPLICRKWPIIEHFGFPRLIKGCGFKAIPRKKASPLTVLKDEELK